MSFAKIIAVVALLVSKSCASKDCYAESCPDDKVSLVQMKTALQVGANRSENADSTRIHASLQVGDPNGKWYHPLVGLGPIVPESLMQQFYDTDSNGVKVFHMPSDILEEEVHMPIIASDDLFQNGIDPSRTSKLQHYVKRVAAALNLYHPTMDPPMSEFITSQMETEVKIRMKKEHEENPNQYGLLNPQGKFFMQIQQVKPWKCGIRGVNGLDPVRITKRMVKDLETLETKLKKEADMAVATGHVMLWRHTQGDQSLGVMLIRGDNDLESSRMSERSNQQMNALRARMQDMGVEERLWDGSVAVAEVDDMVAYVDYGLEVPANGRMPAQSRAEGVQHKQIASSNDMHGPPVKKTVWKNQKENPTAVIVGEFPQKQQVQQQVQQVPPPQQPAQIYQGSAKRQENGDMSETPYQPYQPGSPQNQPLPVYNINAQRENPTMKEGEPERVEVIKKDPE